jgi:hypothetical protein
MLQRKIVPPTINGVTLLGIDIDFYCIIEPNLNIGHLKLTNDGKECLLDTPIIEYDDSNNHTTVRIQLELVSNDFNEEDFNGFEGSLWVEEGFEIEPESITVFTKSGGCTIANEITYS